MYQTKNSYLDSTSKMKYLLTSKIKISIDNQSEFVLNKKSILLFYLISQCESNLWIIGYFCCKLYYQAISYSFLMFYLLKPESYQCINNQVLIYGGIGHLHNEMKVLLKYAMKLILYLLVTILRSNNVGQ